MESSTAECFCKSTGKAKSTNCQGEVDKYHGLCYVRRESKLPGTLNRDQDQRIREGGEKESFEDVKLGSRSKRSE